MKTAYLSCLIRSAYPDAGRIAMRRRRCWPTHDSVFVNGGVCESSSPAFSLTAREISALVSRCFCSINAGIRDGAPVALKLRIGLQCHRQINSALQNARSSFFLSLLHLFSSRPASLRGSPSSFFFHPLFIPFLSRSPFFALSFFFFVRFILGPAGCSARPCPSFFFSCRQDCRVCYSYLFSRGFLLTTARPAAVVAEGHFHDILPLTCCPNRSNALAPRYLPQHPRY